MGNCRAQAPRPGNVGVAGRGSDRPTDWRVPPWRQPECRKPSSGSMSGNRPTGHASRPETARCCRAPPIANREGDPDSLFGRFPGALVVVDQSRNTVSCHFAKNASMDGVPGFSPVIRHSFEMALNRLQPFCYAGVVGRWVITLAGRRWRSACGCAGPFWQGSS